MLSKAKISKLSGIPITTVKSYMEHFEEFFAPETSHGGKRLGYSEASVEIVRRIRELSNQQVSRDEIRQVLRQEFDVVWTLEAQSSDINRPPVAPQSSDENPFLDMTQSLSAAWHAVEALNQMNDELGKTIAKQTKRLQERGKAIRKLYDLYEHQQKTIKTLEKRLDEEAREGLPS